MADNDKQIIRFDNPAFKFFIAIPRIAKIELDPYEFKLYAHYIDECTWNGGQFQQGLRRAAEECQIGYNKTREAQSSLEAKGYIHLQAPTMPDSPTIVTILTEVWGRNYLMFANDGDKRKLAVSLVEQLAQLPEMSEVVASLAARISATGGTDKSQGGTDKSQGQHESVPDSYIEESVKENLSAAQFKAGGEEVEGLDNDPLKKAEDERRKTVPVAAAPKTAGKPAGENKLSAGQWVFDHPLVKLLKEEKGVSLLDDDMLKLLAGDLKIERSDGSVRIYPGGLIKLWDTAPGFQNFVKARFKTIKAWNKPFEPINVLRNFANLNANVPGRWPGFYAWCDANPDLCREITAEERKPLTPEEIRASQPEEINEWAAAAAADRAEVEKYQREHPKNG